jgi:hypothetical protein
LAQEAADGKREAPGEMVIKDHCLPRLRSGDLLGAGGTTAHEIRGREHSTSAQQLDLFLLHPRAFPGSLQQSGRRGVLVRGHPLPFGTRRFGSHPGADLDERNGGGGERKALILWGQSLEAEDFRKSECQRKKRSGRL